MPNYGDEPMSETESASRSKRKLDLGADALTVEQVLAGLEALGVAELRKIVSTANATIQQKADAEKQALIEEMTSRAEALGLSIQDLFGEVPPAPKRGRGKAKASSGEGVQPKYKGPNGELWSGRGRTPKWVQIAEAEGKSKEDLLIR
jgi:DNA-binding protein H-NS